MKWTLFVFVSLLFPNSLCAQDWFQQNPNDLESAFFTDPNTGWAVGEDGTIRHTADGGITWASQSSGTTALLYSVFFTDANSGWVVGTGGTILHTTDAGTIWTAQTSGVGVSLESVFFTDANSGWVVGWFGTIRHTTDGGMTWVAQTSGTGYDLLSVFFTDANTGWAVGELGTIIFTTNGGTAWITQTSGNWGSLESVFFTDANTGWAFGEFGIIPHTTNGGRTWTARPSGTNSWLYSVFFTDPNTGWTVGEDGTILHTTNGGMTWSAQTSGTTEGLYSVFFTDANTGWAVGQNGTILHTNDGGIAWITQTSGTNSWLYSVFFADANTGWAVGGESTIRHTTDGGITWTAQTSGTNSLESVFFTDANTGWAVGFGYIRHTTDGGTTWTAQTTHILNSVFFTDANTGWAVGDFGHIVHTTNGGTTWITQPSGTGNGLFSVFFTDANTGWTVGGLGTIRHTTNGGTAWITQTSGTTALLFSVFFTDANTGWAVGTSGAIRHTTNGGTTWTPQTSGTGYDLLSVFFTDANTGWVVGEDGTILHTTNGGTTWITQPSGTGNGLFSVFFTDANTGWTVGGDGTILHTTSGGTGIEPPMAPTLLSPPDGSGVPPSPILMWNPELGALHYTLQVSLSPYFITYVTNQTNITGTSYQLTGLPVDTTYYWRVSVTNDSSTSRWSEMWSFETTFLPSQVALLAPADGALITSDSTLFSWLSAEPDVDRYWFEGSIDSLFTTSLIDSLVSDTVWTGRTLQHNQTYWWKVRAHNSYGWGRFSEVRSFLVYLEAPPSPSLLLPDSGATDVSTDPTLSWSPSPGTEYYAVQLSDTLDFSRLTVDEDSLAVPSYDVTGLTINTTYYWRVSAQNALGSSPWSETWSFRTIVALPAQVVLLSPSDGELISTDTVTFLWRGSMPEVERYYLEYASNRFFIGSIIDSTLTDTTAIIAGFQGSLTYWWRVRALNAAGWGPLSDVWSFLVLITGVEEEKEIPSVYSLSQNYPNPFNPSTIIRYGLPEGAHVTLEVFNMLGERVTMLMDGVQDAGYHEVTFGRAGLASGLYFYRLRARDFVETKKLILMK